MKENSIPVAGGSITKLQRLYSTLYLEEVPDVWDAQG